MKKLLLTSALILWTGASAMAATIGQPAPEFTGMDTKGVEHSLSDFKGKTVVLEWSNPECPYVHKHYDSGNMQATQKAAIDAGVVWLTIVSSAEGKQGNMTADAANEYMTKVGTNPTARILDASGQIGHLYEAKTTPHMFVVSPEGVLVYQGAIDDDSSYKADGIATAKNYVKAAWEAVAKGEAVATPETQPYGCSVKY